jgi:hypothetical protein
MKLLIFLIVGLSPSFFLILYANRKAKKRKLQQNALLEKNAELLGNGELFRVRYCSEARFKKIFKFFPWEATGVLCLQAGKIIFLGNVSKGQEIRLELEKNGAVTEWVGKKNWFKNGMAAWLVITASGRKHYFTSETGTTIFGSACTTQEMYEKLTC